MTLAQWYCLLAGAALLLAGIAGFFVNSSFETAPELVVDDLAITGVQGDLLLGFEVNGWHNVVHLASGLLLLAAFSKRAAAKTVAIAFGVVYGLVAVIGLIDGTDVFGIIPVNPADNILHIALAAAGIVTGLMSPAKDEYDRHSDGLGHTQHEARTGRFERDRTSAETPTTGVGRR